MKASSDCNGQLTDELIIDKNLCSLYWSKTKLVIFTFYLYSFDQHLQITFLFLFTVNIWEAFTKENIELHATMVGRN